MTQSLEDISYIDMILLYTSLPIFMTKVSKHLLLGSSTAGRVFSKTTITSPVGAGSWWCTGSPLSTGYSGIVTGLIQCQQASKPHIPIPNIHLTYTNTHIHFIPIPVFIFINKTIHVYMLQICGRASKALGYTSGYRPSHTRFTDKNNESSPDHQYFLSIIYAWPKKTIQSFKMI